MILHVANGSSTTALIEAAGVAGKTSLWADVLYEGPVPAGLTDAELIDVRTRHLDGSAPQGDPVNDLRRWRAAIANPSSYDELVLWFEHDLFDQLNLIQLLGWMRERGFTSKPVSLVSIGSFPGHPRFKGLGELSPADLASLFGMRQPVIGPQYELAAQAWDAFCAPTPERLDDLRRRDTPALPYLAAALSRFLQEYPWTIDGLSRTERRLMKLADGGQDLRSAFSRMHEGETAYYVTDLSLRALAEELSLTTPPLLTFTQGGPEAEGQALHGSVRLTDVGRAVVAGQQDRVAACGIDRWLGGVHLEGHTNLWRWDAENEKITRW
jgi:hypothetical protein